MVYDSVKHMDIPYLSRILWLIYNSHGSKTVIFLIAESEWINFKGIIDILNLFFFSNIG